MPSAAIQVPCFFLLCALFWKLGALAIAKWSAAEATRTRAMSEREGERTRVLSSVESERTLAIAKGFADITAELKHHGERLGKIEERLDVRDGIADAFEEITGTHAIPVPFAPQQQAKPQKRNATPVVGIPSLKPLKGGV